MKKKNSYAQNPYKWTPARHEQVQEMWAKKRAEKAANAAIDAQFREPSPETSILPDAINSVNAGMTPEPALQDQVIKLRRKNDVLQVKVQIYEDLLLKALKEH